MHKSLHSDLKGGGFYLISVPKIKIKSESIQEIKVDSFDSIPKCNREKLYIMRKRTLLQNLRISSSPKKAKTEDI